MKDLKPVQIERHLNCKHFAQSNKCRFDTVEIDRDKPLELIDDTFMTLLIIGKGSVTYTINKNKPKRMTKAFGLFIDKGDRLTITATKKTRVSWFQFEKVMDLCNAYTINRLKAYIPKSITYQTIEIVEPLHKAVDSIIYYFQDGLKCGLIMEGKLKECFFVLSAYYDPKLLASFLAPLLKAEVSFKEFVHNNYYKVSTVQELADMMNVPLRVFNKQFKENFNMPPYKWILKERGKKIQQRLTQRSIPFSDIIEEFGFSSPSHFTVYCHRQFGMTPSALRQKLISGEKKIG